MGENGDNLNTVPDSGFSVDSILAEFVAERAVFGESEKKPERDAAATQRIVYDSSEQAVAEAQISSADVPADTESFPFPTEREIIVQTEEPVLRQVAKVDETQVFRADSNPFGTPAEDLKPYTRNKSAKPDRHSAKGELDEPRTRIKLTKKADRRSAENEITETEIKDMPGERYAEPGNYAEKAQDIDETQGQSGPDLRERVLMPIAGLLGAISRRREQARKKTGSNSKREQPPELRADKAAIFYESQARMVKRRGILATVVTLVLLYLSVELPAMGPLGESPAIRTLVCVVLLLVVMVIGLDVFSNGIITLMRGRAGAESIIAVACVVSIVDGVSAVATGNASVGTPFCGAAALAVTMALWGSHFSCRGFAVSFATAGKSGDPTVVLSLAGIDEAGSVLVRSKRPVTGFVRSSEASDIFESTYRLAAPVLIAGSIVLSLFVFFASEKCDNLLRTLAATTAACASLSAVFGFAFPFYVLSKRLAKSGAAIAGYSGAADLGRIRRVLVTDTDIFPVRTVSIADVSVSGGARSDVTISYTGSMIAAAGLGIAPVFRELMQKNGYSMQKVEDFACHEGGGLAAHINGDVVYVGTSGFMQLMGVRLPRSETKPSAIYTAINNTLAGVILMNYKPVASVQRALVTLLRGKCDPLFAIRDFNITPMLVKQKFRLPRDSYNFPSFADRYRVSSPAAEEGGEVVGMFSRGGINSVAGLSKRGRGFYVRLNLCLALSILGAALGAVMMLVFCWTGSYDSASCGNVIAYMLLWLAPTLITSLGLRS